MPDCTPMKNPAVAPDQPEGRAGAHPLLSFPWKRTVVLTLVIGALAALTTSATLHAALLRNLDALEKVVALHPVMGGVALTLLAAVSAMFAFVSVAVVVPVAVVTWGLSLTLAMLWLGWILGGIGAYSIGRWAGRPAMRWFTDATALDRLERTVQHTASFWLVLIFQLALPSEIPGYVLGLARYRFSRYLLALALAELPYAVATVYVGAGLVQGRSVAILGWGLGMVLLGGATMHVLKRVLAENRHREDPK